MKNPFFRLTALAVFTLVCTTSAHAQATRTWVSGVGDDANPCSRTAPCKTFAGAISKTAAKGEISVLDPAGFGAVNITKSLTISGDGSLAGVLASAGNGINVNVAATDTVILRNLSINGLTTAQHGVSLVNSGNLVIEDCRIWGFASNAVNIAATGNANVVINKTKITGGMAGVLSTTTTGRVNVSIDGTTINGAAIGVDSQKGFVNISNSVVTQNSGFGLYAENTSTINVEHVMIVQNGVGVQAQTGAIVRLSNNAIYDNLTGFGCGGGTLASVGDNRKGGNTGGMGAACSPTVSITVQ